MKIKDMDNLKFSRTESVIEVELEESLILNNFLNGETYEIRGISYIIWQYLISENLGVIEVIKLISDKFPLQEQKKLETDVISFVQDLVESGLVETKQDDN